MEFNREKYLKNICDKLYFLGGQVETFSSLNMLNDNINSEKFYCSLLNEIFDLSLIPTSSKKVNFDSIDLVDDKNKCCVQISSDKSKKKLDDTLSGDWIKNHNSYKFIFICLINNHGNHPTACDNKYSINFDLERDYYDCMKIVQTIGEIVDINKIKRINQLVIEELGTPDLNVIDSSLSFVVKTIYKKKIDQYHKKVKDNTFEIDKKIAHNNLLGLKQKIHNFSIYKNKLDSIYNEMQNNGIDGPSHMFSYINDLYLLSSANGLTSIPLFYKILDTMDDKVLSELKIEDNYKFEDIHFACFIVLVDSFIRCKVFENPEGYSL